MTHHALCLCHPLASCCPASDTVSSRAQARPLLFESPDSAAEVQKHVHVETAICVHSPRGGLTSYDQLLLTNGTEKLRSIEGQPLQGCANT